jgi:3-hydroxyisobutyrate dehydrogenase
MTIVAGSYFVQARDAEPRRRSSGRHDPGTSEQTAGRRVGLVGLGRMGMSLCARLTDCGFVVAATDIQDALRDELPPGATWSLTVSAVARDADVLITTLPDAGAVSAIASEVGPVLAADAIWIEMSTASPQASVDVSRATPGTRVLDAPVSGAPDDARRGALLTFVGGAAADLTAARPGLNRLADRVVHVGPRGTGYMLKLLANLLWFEQAVAIAEVLTVAKRAGIDLDVLREAVGLSASASRFRDVDADALLDGDDLTSFSLARCCEQLAGICAVADHLNVPFNLAAHVSRIHHQALERYGDVDGELLPPASSPNRPGSSYFAISAYAA